MKEQPDIYIDLIKPLKHETIDLKSGILNRQSVLLDFPGDAGSKYMIKKYRQSIWRKRFEIAWLFLVMAWKNKR